MKCIKESTLHSRIAKLHIILVNLFVVGLVPSTAVHGCAMAKTYNLICCTMKDNVFVNAEIRNPSDRADTQCLDTPETTGLYDCHSTS